MNKTLAAASKSIALAGAAAVISLGSVIVPATAAHASPTCPPLGGPCTFPEPPKPKCKFVTCINPGPDQVLDPGDNPKPPTCKIKGCQDVGGRPDQVLDPGGNNPTPPKDDNTPPKDDQDTTPPKQDEGNGTPSKDQPTTSGNSSPANPGQATGSNSGSNPGSNPAAGNSATTVLGQPVSSVEAAPDQVEIEAQAADSQTAPSGLIWMVLGAVLASVATLAFTRISRRRAGRIG